MAANEPDKPDEPDGASVSRRRMLGGALVAGLTGTAAGAIGGGLAGHALAADHHGEDDNVDLRRSYPFYGQLHQGGIATLPQRYAVFMSFSLAAGATRAELQALLARWSAAIAVLQQGKPVGAVAPQVDAAAQRYRRGVRTEPGESDRHDRFGTGTVRRAVRVGRPTTRGIYRPATAQRRQPGSAAAWR